MAYRFVAGREQRGVRVDKALARLLPAVSRTVLQRWIDEGRVKVDGSVCSRRHTVREGAVLEVEPGTAPESAAEPDASVQFPVLFEDEHLLVVDKPAGMVVHPAKGNYTGTLVNGLLAHATFGRPSADPLDAKGAIRPGIVHRLDKGTSGVLVVAKDETTREGLKRLFATHDVSRLYWAVVIGVPQVTRIDTLYGRHPKSRLKFTSKSSSGKRAVTNLRLLEQHVSGITSLVECRLETGRTHQIRVHLAEQAKTPVFADVLYGGMPKQGPLHELGVELGRQALHAKTLGFIHPISGQSLHFEAPLPEAMAHTLEKLRLMK